MDDDDTTVLAGIGEPEIMQVFPTMDLRWRNDVLEQAFDVVVVKGARTTSQRREWRMVPESYD